LRVPPWIVVGPDDPTPTPPFDGPYAVRSSAHDEDGAAHSFAGQHDTFLDVAELAPAIAKVQASAFSERAIAYRNRHALPPPRAIDVIVQRMVRAEVSGVCFTADPTSGDRTNLTVAATRGLGDALVSGAVAGDSYTLARTGAVLARDGDALTDAQLAEL